MGAAFREASIVLDRPHVVVCETHAGCARAVQQHATQAAAVLVKGSRGLAMEHVINELRTVH
jgi:UDP-N-acetylmuramyl pentapeptide synthase